MDKSKTHAVLTSIIEAIKDNLYIDDVYSQDEIIEWVKDNKTIDINDLFDDRELADWAEDNGYVKKE